jgi:glycosyltransferase involved in cell wall biosynthesis
VISTRSGGKSEIVEDGVTGLLAAQTDTLALIDHCVRLLGSARDREAMGTMARMRIERLYDARRTAEQVGQLFVELATPRKAPHV